MIAKALLGDFHQWHGLSGGTTLDDVLAALAPVRGISTPEQRTRGARRHVVVIVERSVNPATIEVWCGVDGRSVESIELEPWEIDGSAIENQLGAAELQLRDQRFERGGIVTESIHAFRGVTASIVDPFDRAAARRVVHLQLYSAMSVSEYLTEVGVAAHPRPHPTEASS